MIAEILGFHFHETSTSQVMKEGGFVAVADMPMVERLAAQEYVLARHIADLEALPRPCIVDRTPLDMLAYLMGEVTMHNTSPELWPAIDEYRKKAIRVTDLHYDAIVFLRPLSFFEAAPDKPPPNVAYQWHIQMLIEGAALQLRNVSMCRVASEDLEDRVESGANFIVDRMKTQAKGQLDFPRH